MMTTLSKQGKDLGCSPDPWETNVSTTIKNNFVSNSANLMMATDRLFPIIKDRELFQLPGSKLDSMQIIIKDWLKLKTQVTQHLSDRVREAIALLWLLAKKS